MRHALQVGLDEDQVRSVMGGQVARLLAGEEPLDLGPPVGSGAIPHDAVVERAYAFLLTSLGQMFAGVDPVENLALASLACAVDDDEPQAHLCRWIVSLIERRADYVPGGPRAAAALRPRAADGGAGRHARPNPGRAAAGAPLRRVLGTPSPPGPSPSTNISKPIGGWKVTCEW